MAKKVIVQKNSYYDSVTLMSLSGKILNEEGVKNAVVLMGTEMNKELIGNVGMMTEDVQLAGQGDLLIAIETDTDERAESVFGIIDEALNSKKKSKQNNESQSVTTFNSALLAVPDANMAVISVPGEYAAREARQALNNGLNVMLFSDNVSLEEEKELKVLAKEKGLLVMGPDCGTAIIGGVGLCFANNIRKGDIGIVAASGTGLQEVAVQIDRMGYGITHAIGTGGRDLSEDIGGIMMLEGLRLLDEDDETKVITLISKPPAKSVQQKILEAVKHVSKPVVICFLDGDKQLVEKSGAIFAGTLIDGARQSIAVLTGNSAPSTQFTEKEYSDIELEKNKLKDSQKYIRGLFCGGTLTAEALSVLRDKVENITSNVSKKESEKLESIDNLTGNALLDMGDDEFTKGKPHPMIEPSLRNSWILDAARDESVAVLLLDFEIGYGSHNQPVDESYKALVEAQQISRESDRHLSIVAYVCGTSNDKQNLDLQEKKLRELGVIVADSNEKASLIAVSII